MRFRPAATLTPAAVAAILEQVRVRVLCGFPRRGLIDRDDVHERLAGENSGSSLDASVRVAAPDRTGLERLLRYCARPPFALERREPVNAHQVIDHLPKPRGDGRTALSLMPLECIDHLAALIPPPRRHRHRYPEGLAPHSPRRATSGPWLLARRFESLPLVCPHWGAARRMIAFITEAAPVEWW